MRPHPSHERPRSAGPGESRSGAPLRVSAGWSRRRWATVIGAIAAAQLAFVFWLGERGRVTPRSAAREPQLVLASRYTGDVAELEDPTLFAWANPHGFSGPAWLAFTRPEHRLPDWSEPPRFFEPDTNALGASVQALLATNAPAFAEVAPKPVLRVRGELPAAPPTALAGATTWRLEGALAARRLETPIAAPDIPHPDVLLPTVVNLVVDARGRAVSAAVLETSGHAGADRLALRLARTAHFEALAAGAGLALGRMIFDWHTVPPPPATNPPAVAP